MKPKDQVDQSDAEAEERRRDEMLRQLLKTPPQPRPKRERKPKKIAKKPGK